MRLRAENIVSAADTDEYGTTRVIWGVDRVTFVPPEPSNRDRRELMRWVADFGGVIAPYVP